MFSVIYRVVSELKGMAFRVIIIFFLFNIGLIFLTTSLFYESYYFSNFFIALRTQFALLFNDNLLTVCDSIYENNKISNIFVFLYATLSWLMFTAFLLKLFVSVITITFHYIRKKKNQIEIKDIKTFLLDEANRKFKDNPDLKDERTEVIHAFNYKNIIENINAPKDIAGYLQAKKDYFKKYSIKSKIEKDKLKFYKAKILFTYNEKIENYISERIFNKILLKDLNHSKFLINCYRKLFRIIMKNLMKISIGLKEISYFYELDGQYEIDVLRYIISLQDKLVKYKFINVSSS